MADASATFHDVSRGKINRVRYDLWRYLRRAAIAEARALREPVVDSPPLTTSYRLRLTCPYDGHPIMHEASGVSNGWETRAVARCTACGAQLLIAVTIACNGHRKKVA